MMDRHTKAQRSFNMSQVKSKNTLPERMIFGELTKRKLKFKKHHNLLGKPDVVFLKEKVAVFIDGEFWHGKDYEKEKGGYKKFWRDKIKKNIDRDQQVNRELRKKNWVVVRLWESEISRNLNGCFDKIRRCLEETKNE